LVEAQEKAYKMVEAVNFESKYFRPDIGHREFSRS
jgi:phosphoribosylamine-glycine ligase